MQSYQQNADIIGELPIDQSVPSHNEINMVNTLFKQNKSIIYNILDEIKSSILIGILFIIFSLPQIDEFIKKIIPAYAGSMYILLIVKAVILVIIFYLINNLYLMKK